MSSTHWASPYDEKFAMNDGSEINGSDGEHAWDPEKGRGILGRGRWKSKARTDTYKPGYNAMNGIRNKRRKRRLSKSSQNHADMRSEAMTWAPKQTGAETNTYR